MNIIRVNMKEKSITTEELPREWQIYGNRGLTAKIINKEIPPTCEPLGRKNKLIFANGPMAMPNVSSSGRLSAGGKSPMTGGIKESNSGGIAAFRLAKQGIRALIFEDKPEDKESRYLLYISKNGIGLEDTAEYKFMRTGELTEKLFEKYGKDVGIICIGPTGERLMSAAAIVITDVDRSNSRFAARGGLAAVMGSKGIKAIVIANDGDYKQEIKNPERFQNAVKAYVNELRTAPGTSVNFPLYGTAGIMLTINRMGGMPTYAFRSGSFEKADEMCGERLHDVIVERGGEGTPTHACMPGCIIRSSNIFPCKNGKKIVASLEYETLCLLGSNIGVSDVDDIAELNVLCNDYGIDTIEMGVTTGIYMDLGLASFGDFEAAKDLVTQVGEGTLLGKILGEGAVITGRIFKSLRVPATKGQAMAGHEPRAIKGMSVTYATTPMGADHTTGGTTRSQINHLSYEGQMELSRDTQVRMAAVDTLGMCMFVTSGGAKIPPILVEILNGVYGTDYPPEFIQDLGKEILLLERQFNLKAGLNEAHDTMPEFMKEEPMPPNNTVSDIPEEHYRMFWDGNYWRKAQ